MNTDSMSEINFALTADQTSDALPMEVMQQTILPHLPVKCSLTLDHFYQY